MRTGDKKLNALTLITTTTVNIYAQNFPSTTTMGTFVLAFVGIFLVPLILTALFRESGDVIVTIFLFGAFLGGLLGSLASNQIDASSGTFGYVPWGMTFYLAVALVVWLVKGGGH